MALYHCYEVESLIIDSNILAYMRKIMGNNILRRERQMAHNKVCPYIENVK